MGFDHRVPWHGRLTRRNPDGPFNAWVTAPGIGGRLADLGAALRFESSIERRLLEVTIITVGARWHAGVRVVGPLADGPSVRGEPGSRRRHRPWDHAGPL